MVAAEGADEIVLGSFVCAAAIVRHVRVRKPAVVSLVAMGVGATRGLSAVRWGIVGNILWAWLLTLPTTFLLAGGIMYLYRLF